MQRRRINVLDQVACQRRAWERELWVCEKFMRGKRQEQRKKHVQAMLAHIERLDQWCRERMTTDELEELVG
jgi:hypothetical protein